MKHSAYPTSFGIGRFQDKRKAELCRLLEVANINLAQTRDLIVEIFEPDTTAEPMKHGSAQELSNRVYRIQEQIAELKRLVKQ